MARWVKSAVNPKEQVLTEAPEKEIWLGPKDRSILSDEQVQWMVRSTETLLRYSAQRQREAA
jgi:hypothetical protein